MTDPTRPTEAELEAGHAKPRHVWMGGDYIDDGRHKATPEEAKEQWQRVREALVDIEHGDGRCT